MKICVIRKIDNLGRVVIPKDIRDLLALCAGDDLEIAADDRHLIITKTVRPKREPYSGKTYTDLVAAP